VKEIVVNEVEKGSFADKAGIQKGDILLSINEMSFSDILEYRFLCNDESVLVEFKKPTGEVIVTEVFNDYADLGISFSTPLIDDARRCQNKCVFCFIDQLAPNMREPLYFKDDDTRLSLLHGNFVTLTNLSDEEIDNIIFMHLSPIYISVHTTNGELRKKMLCNKRADNLLPRMKKLSDSGIKMRTQIVLCPGLNDGEELKTTLDDLAKIPMVENVSVVPVGLSKYREGLYPLKPVTEDVAKDVLNIVSQRQAEFLKQREEKLCHASDEFYIKANMPFPSVTDYGNGVNLEDGVGLVSTMTENVQRVIASLDSIKTKREVSLVSGVDAYPIVESLCHELEENCEGLTVHVYPIVNDFFGHGITVTGLLTGQDLIHQLRGKKLGEEILISSAMLKYGEKVFLDDVTCEDVARELGVNIHIIYEGYLGEPFVEAILNRPM